MERDWEFIRKCDQWSLSFSEFSLTENLYSDKMNIAKTQEEFILISSCPAGISFLFSRACLLVSLVDTQQSTKVAGGLEKSAISGMRFLKIPLWPGDDLRWPVRNSLLPLRLISTKPGSPAFSRCRRKTGLIKCVTFWNICPCLLRFCNV